MRRNHLNLLALTAVLMFVVFGCAPKAPVVDRPTGVLAVAGFTNPTRDSQLLAGYLEEPGKPVAPEVLSDLDSILVDTLASHAVFDYIKPHVVGQCQSVVVFEEGGLPRMSAWKYWLGVAKCIPADYLLVPQVVYWKERVGSTSGSTSPASVILEFYLIDVKNERLNRVRFDETQVALSENLLTAGKFASRGGKWITATQLAAEGIEAKLLELGL